MGKIFYRCPNCEETSIIYDYMSRMLVCAKCQTPLKDFERYILKKG